MSTVYRGGCGPLAGGAAAVIFGELQLPEPHPALVLDRYWNAVRTNEAAPRFFSGRRRRAPMVE